MALIKDRRTRLKLLYLKLSFFKYSGVSFCIFLILLYLFTFNFVVESTILKTILISTYYVIAAVSLFGMYKSEHEKLTRVTALLLPLLLLPMVYSPVLLIPLIGLLFLLSRFKEWKTLRNKAISAFVVLDLIAGYVSFVASIFSGLAVVSDLKIIVSPNQEHILILRESDHGAFGGSVSVLVEDNIPKASFAGIVSKKSDLQTDRKVLYYGRWDSRPELSWIDNENVEIDGRVFNIYNYEKWYNYQHGIIPVPAQTAENTPTPLT